MPHPNVWSSQLTNDGGQQQKFQWGRMKILCLFFTLNLDLEEKRMERSNCTGQLTKGGSQLRPCWYGEKEPNPLAVETKRNLWAHISDMFRHNWIQVLTQSLSTSVSFYLSVLVFLCVHFILGQSVCVVASAAPGPKLTRKRISPPNTSHRSLLLSCFGSDLDHKPTADPLPVARVVEYTEWLR